MLSPGAPSAPPPHQRGAPPPSETSRDFCVPSLLIHPTEYATKSHRFGTSFCSYMPSSFQRLPPCAVYGLTSQTSKLFKTFYNLALTVYTLYTVLSQIMLGFYLASPSPLLVPFLPPTEALPVHPLQTTTLALRLPLIITREKN